MVVALGSPQPVFALPPLEDIPDGEEDAPVDGLPVKEVEATGVPEIVFGAATFSHFYNSEATYSSDLPVRTVRLALRYGIRAFDTSPYYGPSEIVLGTALKVLESEFPRSSYQIMTKCGRYGSKQSEFDYSPATIRASVKRSLARLHTTYLDTVYLHDVEYVCAPVGPAGAAGNPDAALAAQSAEYGLAEGQEGKIWGPGDQKILDAVAELRRLQDEGLVKNVGISGLPLPVLLRLALLVRHTPPYRPLDALLSYVHVTLQNALFATHARAQFAGRAGVRRLATASPLCMGLLTLHHPAWHPAHPGVKHMAMRACAACRDAGWEGGLPALATGFAFARAGEEGMPVVVGLSSPREVHECVRAWRVVREGKDAEKRVALENEVAEMFGGMQGWMWESPDPEALKD